MGTAANSVEKQAITPITTEYAGVAGDSWSRKASTYSHYRLIAATQCGLTTFTCRCERLSLPSRCSTSHRTILEGRSLPDSPVLKLPVWSSQLALNPTIPGVTSVYDKHGDEPELKEALQKWTDHLDQLRGAKSPLASRVSMT